MQLVKEGKYTEVSGERNVTDLVDLINLMVNYYQSTFLPIEDWLTKQERRFFIACVIISNRKLRYTGPQAMTVYKEIFNLRRQSDIRGHLRRLEEKKWLRSNKSNKTIQVIEFFNFDLESGQMVKVDVTINYTNGTNR